jgi:hypothetical protein
VGPDCLLDRVVNCCHSWCLPDSRVSCCQVVYLARFKIGSSLHDTLGMSDTCPLQSFSSNSTFIMLYLYHELDVDYLVVNEMINISKLFDYNCMISIGCKPMMLTT